MRKAFIATGLAGLLLISACGSLTGVGRSPVVTLPLNFAWVEGRKVEYVTTDISDSAMAHALGVNFVPRLAQALPVAGRPSAVERVYKFADDSQITVFQSAPSPTGPANADASYSPLWRMVLVRWKKNTVERELKSEEQILQAAEANEVSMDVTDIVVNCPITRSVDGMAIRGVDIPGGR